MKEDMFQTATFMIRTLIDMVHALGLLYLAYKIGSKRQKIKQELLMESMNTDIIKGTVLRP